MKANESNLSFPRSDGEIATVALLPRNDEVK